jgi:hypothetical protein
MKKIITLFAVLFAFNVSAYTVDLSHINLQRDTSFVIEHPNSNDSILAVNIIHGIVSVLPVQASFFKALATPENVGAFVGFVFFLWRLIEKRRLRKKGLLIDKTFGIFLILMLSLNFNASASVPIDSVQAWQKKANAYKIPLNTYVLCREYSALSSFPLVFDSVKTWQKKASSYKLTLPVYMNCLIYSATTGGGSVSSSSVIVSPNDSTYAITKNDSLVMSNTDIYSQTSNLKLYNGEVTLNSSLSNNFVSYQNNFTGTGGGNKFDGVIYSNGGLDAFPTTTLNIANNNVTTLNLGQNTSTINISNEQIKSNGTTLKKYGTSNTGSLTVTSTTVETVINSTYLPANSFTDNNNFNIYTSAIKTNTTVNCSLRVYINTTNTLSGATLIAYTLSSAPNQFWVLNRNFLINGTNMYTTPVTQSSASDLASNTAYSPITVDFTQGYYFLVTLQSGLSPTGTFGVLGFWLKP